MTADRRQLTVLSCDIVDSTRFADALDPEDFQVILTAFFETCKAVIKEHRGTLAHHTGDGFLVYFGFPITQDRNSQEAIECGHAIIKAIRDVECPSADHVQVRIGIATGLVVLSDIERLNSSTDVIAFGGVLHLAARIQALAHPGSVFVDHTTYKLAHRNFAFKDRGTHKLKGFVQPKHVWEAGDLQVIESRFEERREPLTAFIGRDRELLILDNCWRRAQKASGQAVVIAGDPGIGKSRLVFEFIRRIAPSVPPLVFQCLENHEHAPLHPWINFMLHLAQTSEHDSPEVRGQKIGKVLDRAFPNSGSLRPFTINLISQSSAEPTAQDDTNPTHKLEMLRAAIIDRLTVLAQRDVQVVVVEDIQWMDPSSKAIWTSLIERTVGTRVLILATCRMDKIIADTSPQVTHLFIDRLSSQQSIELTNQIIDNPELARSVMPEIVKRSDGVPLFIEEMAYAIAETDYSQSNYVSDHHNAGRNTVVHPTIPDTLHGTLLARLDQTGEIKTLAQTAAVIGRDFDVGVLAKLTSRSESALENDLSALVKSGLIRRSHKSSAKTFEFKHSLVREAAYNGLLRRDAARFHSDLAIIYEQHFPGMKSARPEVIAQHLTMASRYLDASAIWLDAGIAAQEMGSTTEATKRFDQCLTCLTSAQSSAEAQLIRMKCQIARGKAINSQLGPAARSTQEAFNEAAKLGEILKDWDATLESLVQLFYVTFNSGDITGARKVAQRMAEFGARYSNKRSSVIGAIGSGMCSFAMGRFQRARTEIEDALEQLSGGNKYEDSYEVVALSYLALAMCILGHPDKANDLSSVSIELSRNLHAQDISVALGNSLYLACMQKDCDKTRKISNELLQLSEEKGYSMWYHQARFFLGWVYSQEGQSVGLEMMESAMQRFKDAQELAEQTFFYHVLAHSYLRNNCLEEARKNVELGLDAANQMDERFFEVPLLQLRAECLRQTQSDTDSGEIESLLLQAEQLAIEQEAILWCRTS